MRTLSSALSTALGQAVTNPAFLVEINWSSPARLSTFSSITWGGYSWVQADLDVRDVSVLGMRVSGGLVLGNADNAFSSAILNEGVVDRQIRVWGYDADATAIDDPVLLVDAVGGKATINIEKARIDLRDKMAFVRAPRTTVCPANGFTYVVPAGKTFSVGSQTYRITRRD